jgi:microcystin degradation protein MlrC
VLDVGPVTILVTELRCVAGNLPGVYEASGVDVGQYLMAVLKTASNFQYFADLTSTVVRVDTRGPGQSDIRTLPWKRIPRPIYPLEQRADWRALGT